MREELVIVRGGGDLATGVAIRLARSGFRVMVSELAHPMSVRRKVSCSEAVFDGEITIEDTRVLRVATFEEALKVVRADVIPVLVDPELSTFDKSKVAAIVDGRLLKKDVAYDLASSIIVIGLGPNFYVGKNCHLAVETERGHDLGKVLRAGHSRHDTGVPEGDPRRVLRADLDGTITLIKDIGDHADSGETIATISGSPVKAILTGTIRGLIHGGTKVTKGVKIGDIDPRDQREFCFTISDKAYAVGGGVLEALLSVWDR